MDEFKAITGIPIKMMLDGHFDHYDANDSDNARSGNYLQRLSFSKFWRVSRVALRKFFVCDFFW